MKFNSQLPRERQRHFSIGSFVSILVLIVGLIPTKLILAGLLVLFGLALMGGTKQGIESATKASAIKGNSEEERKERKRHTDEAVTNIKAAGFAAAVLYPLHKLIKKLIK